MAFTVHDFHDMVVILESEPSWRQELRRLLLTEDILTLPQFVRELAESNRKFEARVETRFDRVESDIVELKTDVSQLKTDVSQLKTDVSQLKTDVGRFNGRDLERMVRERPFVYLSRFALRLQVVDESEIATALEEAVEAAILSESEMEDAKLIDAIARGKRRLDGAVVLLACEISAAVNEYDIQRAVRRAGLIAKATRQEVIPVVLGETISERMRQLADQEKVGWVVLKAQN
jgi:outer membrane murein-binding lipoprotein Lpp